MLQPETGHMKDLYLSVNAQPNCSSDSIYLLFFSLLSSEQYIMQMYFKQMKFILNHLH